MPTFVLMTKRGGLRPLAVSKDRLDGPNTRGSQTDDEAMTEDFDIYDIEHGILTGRIRRSWPREGKYEVVGSALDGRPIGVVCRTTQGGKVRVITVYEDRGSK